MDHLESAIRQEEQLREALSMSTGAAVFFIVTPPGEGKQREMERWSRLLSGWQILPARLSPERPLDLEALRGQLRALRGDRRPMIWMEVEGLGVAETESQPAIAEQAQRVLQDLNFKREALERLDVPIFFWVTPPELRAFSVWAADPFAIRTAIIDLDIDLECLRPTAEKALRIEAFLMADRPRGALPPAEVEGRIRLYKEALEAEARKRRPHLPRIATLYEELSSLYSAIGQREEALQAAQEAVEILRQLAQQPPQAFFPELAMSLNNLGAMLSALGRREEALQATQEAAEIFRRLAQQLPQAFLPDLAHSLHNLGAGLSALGQREGALAATQEAVALRRQLARQHLQAFLPYLAKSLGTHGSVLLGLGHAREARKAFAEGLRILLPFLRAQPAAFQELASALLQGYQRACEALGEAPDAPLIREISRNLVTPTIEPDVLPGSAP